MSDSYTISPLYTNPDGYTHAQLMSDEGDLFSMDVMSVETIGGTFTVTMFQSDTFGVVWDVWGFASPGSGWRWLARFNRQAPAMADACNRTLADVEYEMTEGELGVFEGLVVGELPMPSDPSDTFRAITSGDAWFGGSLVVFS